MGIRNIVTNEDPILRKKSRVVTDINDRIKILAEDLVETMREAEGLGLAAPQVGVLRRVAVVQVGEELHVMINPEVKDSEGEQLSDEGCLSVPGLAGRVCRPLKVRVSYTRPDGSAAEVESEGLEAVAFCHEIDHLDGILFTDKAEEIVSVHSEDSTEDAVEAPDEGEAGDKEESK